MSVFLAALLDTVGIPVARMEFKQPQSPPYIVYIFTHSNNFYADSKVYATFENYQVELYTVKKDIAIEKALEAVFDDNGICYEKTETFIESEGLMQILYEIQFLGGDNG